MTGGVHATLELMPVKPAGTEDETRVLPGVNMLTMLFIRGKCTIERIPDLFDVFAKVLTDINFDDSRSILQNALKSNLSSKKSSVASSGHSFANQRIRGRYSVEGKSFPKSTLLVRVYHISSTIHISRNHTEFIDEKLYGVSSLESYANILEAVSSDWSKFVIRLKNLRAAILNGSRKGMLLNLTGDRKVLDAIMEQAEEFLANGLPVDLGNPAPPPPNFAEVEHPWIASARDDMLKSNPVRDEGIVVSTQVAYVGEGGRLYDVNEPVKGSVMVVSHYLTTGK